MLSEINHNYVLFHRVQRAYHNVMAAEMSQQGLHDVGHPFLLFALRNLGSVGIPAQRDLADLMRLSPATVAISLKSLERAGYVRRLQDTQDARRNLVVITDRGIAAADRCKQIFARIDEMTLSGFSEPEAAQLSAFWQRILNNLNAGPAGGEDGCPC